MPKNFYKFKNKAEEVAELAIYDEISWWGVSAMDFKNELQGVTASKIVVRLNSPGGSLIDGLAIYNLLRTHKAKIEVRVDGIAASIAGVIAMAGDAIIMPENTFMFLHLPLVDTGGNADELREVAETLDKMRDSIAGIFEARTGADNATVLKWMEEETMFSAAEALEAGLATEVLPEIKVTNAYRPEKYFSDKIVQNLNPVEASASGGTNIKTDNPNNTMTPEEIQTLENKVSSLEAQKSTDDSAHVEALETAKTDATNEAKTEYQNAEKVRKDEIKAISDKYNKDGDLDKISITALLGDTTVENFMQEVLDAVNERPGKQAIKPGNSSQENVQEVESIVFKNEADFTAAYEAAENSVDRIAIVKANGAIARKLSRG